MTKQELIRNISLAVDGSLLLYRLTELSGNGSPTYFAMKARELPIEISLEEIKNALINNEINFNEELIVEVRDMITSLNELREISLKEENVKLKR